MVVLNIVIALIIAKNVASYVLPPNLRVLRLVDRAKYSHDTVLKFELDSDAEDAIDPFVTFRAELENSLSENNFVKIVVVDNVNIGNELHQLYDMKSILGRVVMLRSGMKAQLTLRYTTKDIMKNFSLGEAASEIMRFLENGFKRALLTTTHNDFELNATKQKVKLKKKPRKPGLELPPPSLSHDRVKITTLSPTSSFFTALGVTSASGRPRSGMTDKYRQIQKFVEVLSGLVEGRSLVRDKNDSPGRTQLRVLDVGSGMGYLTFATHLYLSQLLGSRGVLVSTTGLEIRRVSRAIKCR